MIKNGITIQQTRKRPDSQPNEEQYLHSFADDSSWSNSPFDRNSTNFKRARYGQCSLNQGLFACPGLRMQQQAKPRPKILTAEEMLSTKDRVKWTEDEDGLLQNTVKLFGQNWQLVCETLRKSNTVGGRLRSIRDCMQRWHVLNTQNPVYKKRKSFEAGRARLRCRPYTQHSY